ncbi:phosphotriesterase family protein [Luethyella okanaganae]|uniref:Phosphotriesterase n=1 Tax=Luethyella okanaganae TaxID=69372 RepID=A0ABW1VHK5_9MICO
MTTVQTVTGPVSTSELGIVLPHEHLVNDLSAAYSPASDQRVRDLLDAPVSADLAWLLKEHPYNSVDNCRLDDLQGMAEDLTAFRRLGGGTVIDLTPPGLGRHPEALEQLSRQSGVNIIMGSGWYLEHFQDEATRAATVDALADSLLADFDRPGARPGVIGEIGVSPVFSAAEQRALRAAAMVQKELGVPLFIHTPAWKRMGARILDLVIDEGGVDPGAVVLCHMDPSHDDAKYQMDMAERGVMLGFDMIGMPFTFPSEGESPGPGESADAIARLVRAGFGKQILLSHDLFLKSMLTKHGGNGFNYVPFAFPFRLHERGISPKEVTAMLTSNPAGLFTNSTTE